MFGTYARQVLHRQGRAVYDEPRAQISTTRTNTTMSLINITQINAAIPGLGLTGAFIIDTLKVPPAKQEKRALFWNNTDWPTICGRLTEHVAKGATLDPTTFSGERTKAPAAASAAGDEFFGDGAAPTAEGGQGDDFFNDAAPAAESSEFFG
jgi:hypothetical protein